MIKKLLLLFILLANSIYALERLITSKGEITFEASVAFFEAVEAKNNNVFCTLNVSRGQIYFTAYITDFRFERSLMEQHFNENYLESKRYPKAVFKGVIDKSDSEIIDATARKHWISGKITIHGKSKRINVPAFITKTKEGILIKSEFALNTDDFNITIPFMVRSKIAKKVNVAVVASLK